MDHIIEQTTKKISVIVPIYNMEQYLERCVDSILGQSYHNLEIILVDDGSTDHSPEMCDAYAVRDDRIRVVHKQNGGLSDARNAGMGIATGDYYGFVDSDDWIEPLMYEEMLTACEDHQAQLAICRYAEIHGSQRVDDGTGRKDILSREEALDIYICERDGFCIYNSVWSKLFSKELIREMRFPVGHNSEDIMFTTRAFCRMEKCVYLDHSYYNYVVEREGSIMNEISGERTMRDEIPFWQEHIVCIREAGLKELAEKAAYHYYKRLLIYDLRFRKSKANHSYALELEQLIKSEKDKINIIYSHSFVKRGDRARMKLFLVSPALYRLTNTLYEKTILAIRRG
ncbi:MAG: glycosyltransferase [Lachnospiraceae bacterium]|nr:glycosyltransferase [Lachnospiraceae bacterium]